MINPQKDKRLARLRRHKKVRAKIQGTGKCPRLSVFRSIGHIYVQLIDDEKGKTLVSASDPEFKKIKIKNKKSKTQIKKKKTIQIKESFAGSLAIAYGVGKLVAEKALKKKIKKVVFDRGGYKYHGRVKAVAEGAREGGLKF